MTKRMAKAVPGVIAAACAGVLASCGSGSLSCSNTDAVTEILQRQKQKEEDARRVLPKQMMLQDTSFSLEDIITQEKSDNRVLCKATLVEKGKNFSGEAASVPQPITYKLQMTDAGKMIVTTDHD